MKKFEQVLKEKAHLAKIKQAKKTISSSNKPLSRMGSSKVGAEAQLLLQLYQNKSFDSIPAYKLLRTAGLQQYTKGFIIRGYGINLGKLALISDDERKKMYEELKVLPGHTVKLDKIIEVLAKSSYENEIDDYLIEEGYPIEAKQDKKGSKNIIEADRQYQRQLERVLNEYTPLSDQKKRTYNSKASDQKNNGNAISSVNESKYSKTKYVPQPNRDKIADFKKKTADSSTKPTVRKSYNDDGRKEPLVKLLKKTAESESMSSQQVMGINLQFEKIRARKRSFDGALMSSTIANIDIEELVYAFSGLVVSKVIPAPQPSLKKQSSQSQFQVEESIDNIEDEVGQILRESYLHPLYREEVDEEINCEETFSEGEEEEEPTTNQNQFSFEKNKMMESSFLGGQESVQFGISNPLNIFDEPQPTQIDYFKPTIDSVSNFIKNIVLAAKMEREIPIMAAAYLQIFLKKSKLILTSLNYKRLLVTVLLLSSKIWDDESFQTPSFSKTFPQYSTVLINEMEKQVVKYLDYKLKLDKKEYSKTYFLLRKFTKGNNRSYQNRQLTLARIRQMQMGIRKQYKSSFLGKRNSF